MADLRPDPTQGLEYRAERAIFSAFVQQAERTPEAPAIIGEALTCSYWQLEQISQGIATLLLASGCCGSDRVVIVASRCPSLVYAMLGALRAGLTFTVADAAYPAARVAQIVQTMTPAFVLLCGDSQHLPERDLLRPTTGVTDESPQVVRVPPAPDQALRQFPCRPAALPAVDPGQPAYITFTSGSTGVPKGVVTHHAPLVHFIEWHVQRHGFTRDDCFSLLSGLGHDPVYRDVFTPLSIGAKVVCPPQSTLLDPARLAAWIHGHGITAMHLTPPLGKLVAAGASSKARVFERLRYLFWGGDALSPVLFEQIRRAAPNATQVNFYGTTETPQAMAFHQLDGPLEQGRAPLGKGIDGAQLLVVNGAQQLAGEGEAGEILIRSPYLSLGYWGDTALTAEKFVINPFTGALGDICYRSGDLGVYLADGSVAFLGRADAQVKIRGHRIELAEVEGAVAGQPQVEQCVVVANHDNAVPRLVAYCVTASPVSPALLREAIAAQLPEYMVPALFVFLDALPLTPNGKIDKRALPPPFDHGMLSADDTDLALTPQAQQLVEAWAQILQVPHIDTRLTFVELGGDSLTFVQASMVLQALLGQLPQRWEATPVRELAELASRPKEARQTLRAMEVPVFLRMVAILVIVMGHLGLYPQGMIVGETTALFLVSGMGLARFQVNAIVERGDARSLFKSIAGIAVPTLLYTLLVQSLFDRVHWQSLLLVSNWFPASVVGHFNYWYIEVLLQMVLIIGLVLSIKRIRLMIMAEPFRCLLLAACALLVADVLLGLWVFDATALFNRVPQHYLATMVLGMAMHYADTTGRKWAATGVAVLVVGEIEAVTIAGYGWHAWFSAVHIDMALPAVWALIWLRSVPMPGLVAKGGAVIASSTLYIYLTHFQFQSLARRVSDQPVVAVAFAIIGGVAVAYGWNTLVRWALARRKRPLQTLERVA
ncbi:amino acid adenylation domain-containing protein [Pseudomonas sp. NC26]|uniref:Amino acid adenylation domain-containing protein n=3 Tax=Pseudomonas TaxID=286 RepID=A0A7W2KYW8_PSEPU|nr:MULTISPECIES: amino acid adenylation domain-containing protein [Pseudomonas]MBA6115323.1 amino acid adenylation domain-containing protein [Pseudomonas putida]MCZ9639505.1 amino acid adenylation domain-containing protein [Pseudomonas putida]MEC4878092.1 amino acid adenylation domain-containing protein [Pseudomonas sp. NC26]QNL88425.1 Uncharacterized protein PPKH_3011 [Pseudomonas putida]